MDIEQMIGDVIRREGGFTDHPADRGGPTKYGITQATLARHLGRPVGAGDVRRLDRSVAERIYRKEYFEGPRLGALPASVRPFVFDAAVNHGPRRAVRLLQEVCEEAGFGPLATDGVVGPQTVAAASAAERAMGPWLLAALVEQRRMFYRAIVARDPSQSVFLAGWLNRIAEFDTYEELVA